MNDTAAPPGTSRPRTIARVILGLLLLVAGIGHFTFGRQAFAAQVPDWVPLADDLVVIGSGVVELALGASLIALPRHRVALGWLTAALFVAVFPGNINQFVNRIDAFGLTNDGPRAVRLLVQPPLVVWALWSTGAWRDRGELWRALTGRR